MSKHNIQVIALFLAILVLIGLPVFISPAQSRPSLGVTNFDSVHLRDTGPTAQPVLRANQLGAGKIVEFMDSGTPVWSINNGGGVTGQTLQYATSGQRQFCATNTITDTASYTVSTSAVATPVFVWCSLGAITGDASHCAASHATGSVTVIVRNSNATPAASAVGASVNWCVVGTP